MRCTNTTLLLLLLVRLFLTMIEPTHVPLGSTPINAESTQLAARVLNSPSRMHLGYQGASFAHSSPATALSRLGTDANQVQFNRNVPRNDFTRSMSTAQGSATQTPNLVGFKQEVFAQPARTFNEVSASSLWNQRTQNSTKNYRGFESERAVDADYNYKQFQAAIGCDSCGLSGSFNNSGPEFIV